MSHIVKELLLLLILPLVLSACAVLMVGCGGSGDDQKGTTVINQP